jgi:hypothetical protein
MHRMRSYRFLCAFSTATSPSSAMSQVYPIRFKRWVITFTCRREKS